MHAGEDTPARKMQHQGRMSMALTTKALLVAGGSVILVVALVVGVGIKLFDLSGRREDEAERLQDRMTERLRRAVGEVPLTVVAHASASAREPVVIEIAGPVATMEARERCCAKPGSRLRGSDVTSAWRIGWRSAPPRTGRWRDRPGRRRARMDGGKS
jgi:hypothetical protein